jgi:hypothetical protein
LYGGCSDDENGPVVDQYPVIVTFSADSVNITAGYLVNFQMVAFDDVGLDSAILNYGDNNRFLINVRGRDRLSAAAARTYDSAGVFDASLTVYDTRQQAARRPLTITVHN